MDRNTKHAHLYTYLTVGQSFRICYKAQSANDHPSSLKETLYRRIGLQTKQSSHEGNLPPVTAFTSVCVTAGGS